MAAAARVFPLLRDAGSHTVRLGPLVDIWPRPAGNLLYL